MSLIKCPQCTNSVSEGAKSCSACGCPAHHWAPTSATSPAVSPVLLVAGGIAVVTAFALVFFLPWITLALGIGLVLVAVYAFLTAKSDQLVPGLSPRLAGVAGVAGGMLLLALSAVSVAHHRQTSHANREAADLIALARQHIEAEQWDEAEKVLNDALALPKATNRAEASRLLGQVAEGQEQRRARLQQEANSRTPATRTETPAAKTETQPQPDAAANAAAAAEAAREAEEEAKAQSAAAQRREELRKNKPAEDKRRVSEERAYRIAKAEFDAATKLKGVRQLLDSAANAKEKFFQDRFLSRATEAARDIVQKFPGTSAAADAQTYIDTKRLPNRPSPPDPDEKKSTADRLTDLWRAVDIASIEDWGTELDQIPATVVDVGVMKYVPYQSFRAGDYEFNVYGDPDHPAGLEIGVYQSLLKNPKAKQRCLEFMASLLPDAGDRCLLRSLNQRQDLQKRGSLTLEVTPETAEDAYGGWWISVYDPEILDKSRASPKELATITVSKQATAKPTPGVSPSWTPHQLAQARPGGGTVYVPGYYRENGTYVQSHTRSAPGSGNSRKR